MAAARVYFHVKGTRDLASSRVRAFDLADRLAADGVPVHAKGGWDRWKVDPPFWRAPVLLFQKTTQLSDWALARAARLVKRRRLVFDIDDIMHLSGHEVGKEDRKQKAFQDRFLRLADVVTVGSHALKEYAGHLNDDVRLARTPVDLSLYRGRDPSAVADDERLTVGWLGSGSAYRTDLKMIVEPLRAMAEKYPLRVRIVGAQENEDVHRTFRALEKDGIAVDVVDRIDWQRPGAVGDALAAFDVGVYPLRDVPFNLYKGGFKLLEYAASAVPAVASPVGETAHLLRESGFGIPARSEEEWTRALDRLLGDAAFRRRMGGEGRAYVAEHHSFDVFYRVMREALLDYA